MKYICIGLSVLALAVSLIGRKNPMSKEDEMKLLNSGFIEIGGGCEAYFTAKVFFHPQGDKLKIDIDNSGQYFSQHLSAKKKIQCVFPSGEIIPFFSRLKTLLYAPQPELTYVTTRNATLKIFLPFQTDTMEKVLIESEKSFFIDPMLNLLDEFVQDMADGTLDSFQPLSMTKSRYGERVLCRDNLILEYENFSLQYLYPFRDLTTNRSRYFFLLENSNEKKLVFWEQKAADRKQISKAVFSINEMNYSLGLINPGKSGESELIVETLKCEKKTDMDRPSTGEVFFSLIEKILQAGSLSEIKSLFNGAFHLKETGGFREYILADDPMFDFVRVHTSVKETHFQIFLTLKKDIAIDYADALKFFGKHRKGYVSPELKTPMQSIEAFIIDSNRHISFTLDKTGDQIKECMISKLLQSRKQ